MLYRIRVCKTWIHPFAIAFLVSALSFCIVPPAVGQTNDATLNGTVTDSSGAVVPQAALTLENTLTGTSRTGATNGSGQFTMPSLDPGVYALRVEKQGFAISEVKDITLHTADNVALVVKLKVGRADQTVTVTDAQLTTDSPGVRLTVDREFVENMPLNGRSFQDLIQLAPGTVSDQDGYYSVDGQRTNSNNFMVDGVSANLGGQNNWPVGGAGSMLSGASPSQTVLGTTQSLTSIDSLQEFTIQTSGYTADYGRNPGGQVQFTTRSGTNDIHGSLFEYLRNTAFDANSWYNDYNDVPQTAEHQNDFGGTVGGPLIVPRLYNGKDKTFYFLSYEGLRLILPNSESEYVPTQAFRSWADSNAQPFLNVAPLPNTSIAGDSCTISGTAINLSGSAGPGAIPCDERFYYAYSYPNNLDSYSLRVDQNLGTRLHAFVRYADTPSSEVNGVEQVSTSTINSHGWTAGLTAAVSHTLVDDLRFNYSHDGEASVSNLNSVGGSIPLSRNLLIPAAYDSPYAQFYFLIYVPGTSLLFYHTAVGGTGTLQHQYQLGDSLAWAKGTHSLKFGGDWRRLTPTRVTSPYQSEVDFESLAAFQEGYADIVNIGAYAPAQPIFDNLSLYAQDHWKISPRLSIDYGLRWEFNPPPGPSNGFYPVTLTSIDLATATLTHDGTQPYKTNYHSFAPRLGFGWNAIPSQTHPLTVRGGFGIFFDTGQSLAAEMYISNYPFYASRPTETNVPLPLSEAALAPPSLNAPIAPPYPDVFVTDPGLTLPYTEQWNLSIDETLNAKNTLTLSYVGNNGRKLPFSQTYSNLPGNPNFTEVSLATNGSHSSYNALQVQDVGRIFHGLDIVGSFTWAHALDNESIDDAENGPLWGNSGYDLRRVLNLALNYEVPVANKGRWLREATGGWQLANRFSAQSGFPLYVEEGRVYLPNGAAELYTPDLVPGVPIYLHGSAADVNGRPVPGSWRLNRAAFACTTNGSTSGACTGTPMRNGTLGRNYVRNPSFSTLNTSVQRSFPIYERLRLNFRADAFNIMNHPNLGGIEDTLSSSTFGQATLSDTIGSSNPLYAMGAARSLQFSLHLQF